MMQVRILSPRHKKRAEETERSDVTFAPGILDQTSDRLCG